MRNIKSVFSRLALAAVLLSQVGLHALADSTVPSVGNPTTKSGNAVWQVATFPFRLVTGTSTGALGLVGGGVKGVVTTEEKFAANTFGKVDENPILVVPGILGTIVAVPVGFIMGAPEGFVKGAKAGYTWWDSY